METRGGSLAERLEEGRTLFNEGRFFEAHEKWEEAWLEEAGASKRRLQGLIQIAAGLLKARSGSREAAVRLLEAGAEKLASPAAPQGLEDFVRDVREFARGERRRRPGPPAGGEDGLSWPLLPPLPSVK